ncbi:tRNA (adenosine(37)-N6)-dimethylallyltransferase MiaA [Petrachloros mirabilis]
MVVTTLSAFTMSQLSEQQIRRRPLVVIVGPTAAGKSRIAIEVAKRFETDILTADSRQVYRGMDIGTDKPKPETWQGISHRLIDLVDPDEPFNAGRFRRHALEAIEHLYRRRRLPLVVGGTGLYVHALLRGLCDAPSTNHALRARLESEAREEGADRFYARLVAVDPATASKLHPRDTSKIIRALEVYHLSGRPMSEFQRQHGFSEHPFSALVIGLDRDRRHLYRRIEERIDLQLANGLLEETKRLLEQGCRRDRAAMKGLGYRQVAAYLAGECDQAEMVRRFKRDTRHFAKRQMTWFRRDPAIVWLKIEESESWEETANRVIDLIEPFLVEIDRTA